MKKVIFVGTRPWLNNQINALTYGFASDYILKRNGPNIESAEHKDQTLKYYFLPPQREVLQGFRADEWILQEGLAQEIQDQVAIYQEVGRLDTEIYDNIKAHGEIRLEIPKRCFCDIKYLMDYGHLKHCDYYKEEEETK